jgi:hypothetical protein
LYVYQRQRSRASPEIGALPQVPSLPYQLFQTLQTIFFLATYIQGVWGREATLGVRRKWASWDDRHPPEHDTTLADEKSAGNSLALMRYFVMGSLSTNDALAFVPDSLVQTHGREKTPEIRTVAKDII